MARVKTGGRKKGVRNKATAKKEAEIAASGVTPLAYMLDVMRNPGEDPDKRLDAAKSAAPYVHPKLAAIEHTGANGQPLIPPPDLTDPKVINDVARRLAFVLTSAKDK